MVFGDSPFSLGFREYVGFLVGEVPFVHLDSEPNFDPTEYYEVVVKW